MPFNLFGKTEARVDPMEAITKLNDSTEMLEKKSTHLEKQIEKELQSAKSYGTKNKRMALGALKRKKRLEGQLNQIDNTLTTIEFQKESLMNARANAEMLKTMQMAGKAMQNIHKEVGGVDKVDDIMADIEESNMIAGEIGEAISRPMNIGAMDPLPCGRRAYLAEARARFCFCLHLSFSWEPTCCASLGILRDHCTVHLLL